jgi:uncharacterized membrane protein
LERLTKAYLVTATVGVAISIYVANEYLTANFQGCYINQQFSCEGVFQSGHTSLFGIPFYVTGLVWFPLMLAAGLLTTKLGREPLNAEILLPILMVGNVFTGYLWYLELAVIGIVCPLCVSLYVVNYALTALVLSTVI